MTRTPFNWRLFFILLAGATLGLVAVVPYSLALQSDTSLASAAQQAGMPLWLLIAIQLAPQAILFGIVIWVGLSLARSVGLGLPLLEDLLRGNNINAALRRILPISVILGVILGLLIIALDSYVFQPALLAQMGENALAGDSAVNPAAWKGLLASLYGGINEEILLRLFLMSMFVWLGRFVHRNTDGSPGLAVLWIANVLAAVIFGLGHLPATAAMVALTPLVVIRAIVLNGIGGVGFGYLYMKHGLEAAIIAHFSADMILHVLFAV
jgi:membrane protease YdiL (CAAX protease family)